MKPVPALAPLSDFRVRQAAILEMARQGPVVLVERGSRPALVAVTPEYWNAIVERIEGLEESVAMYRARWEVVTGRAVTDEVPETADRGWFEGDLPRLEQT